ncbi:hypothetical protein N8677_00755 [Verrucomicrobia bacterium]|nr:hypothetical protein [Verrucomicrobiota bacterium]
MEKDSFIDKVQGQPVDPYRGSILDPVAPEHCNGEALIGSIYRTLFFSDPAKVEKEAGKVAVEELHKSFEKHNDCWQYLFNKGVLTSSGPRKSPTPYLYPYVPQIALHSAVLGKPRKSRWLPGNLFLNCVFSGSNPSEHRENIQLIRKALKADETGDVFAYFVERSFEAVDGYKEIVEDEIKPKSASAWRDRDTNFRLETPAERFVADILYICSIRGFFPRRQWLAVLESLVRVGISCHQMWICRLNRNLGRLINSIIDEGENITQRQVSDLWVEHHKDPFFELGGRAMGQNGGPIDAVIRENAEGRSAITLACLALKELGQKFESPLGGQKDFGVSKPSDKCLYEFIKIVSDNSQDILNLLKKVFGKSSFQDCLRDVLDSKPKLLKRAYGGYSQNIDYFFNYVLGQFQPETNPPHSQRSHDQSYLLWKPSGAKLWHVKPGPATLLMFASCCSDQRRNLHPGIPASIESLTQYLAQYGIGIPQGELVDGYTGRELHRMGLLIDNPDGGGGRLIVDPFK